MAPQSFEIDTEMLASFAEEVNQFEGRTFDMEQNMESLQKKII